VKIAISTLTKDDIKEELRVKMDKKKAMLDKKDGGKKVEVNADRRPST
jgi:hypothetical protein